MDVQVQQGAHHLKPQCDYLVALERSAQALNVVF
jgi:hypothetical protein